MTLAELKAAPAHAPPRTRLDPVSDLVLQPHVGLLSLAESSSTELEDGLYDVVIDSTLAPGSLTYGECFLRASRGRGALDDARLPSVARQRQPLGDRRLDRARQPPGGDGRDGSPIGFSSFRGPSARSPGSRATRTSCRASSAGLVVACVGDSGPLTYKRSRRGDALVDRAGAHVVAQRRGSGRSTSSHGAGTSGSSTRRDSISRSGV